jgi:hypothetical protein
MPELTLRFDTGSPELVTAFSEVLRAEPDILDRPDAMEAVRQRLDAFASSVQLTGSGRDWRLDGEAAGYTLRPESPEQAGLPDTWRSASDRTTGSR